MTGIIGLLMGFSLLSSLQQVQAEIDYVNASLQQYFATHHVELKSMTLTTENGVFLSEDCSYDKNTGKSECSWQNRTGATTTLKSVSGKGYFVPD